MADGRRRRLGAVVFAGASLVSLLVLGSGRGSRLRQIIPSALRARAEPSEDDPPVKTDDDRTLRFPLVVDIPCSRLVDYQGCVQFPSRSERKRALRAATYAGSGFSAEECQLLCYTYIDSGDRIRKELERNGTSNFEVARPNCPLRCARVSHDLLPFPPPGWDGQYFGMMGTDCYCANNLDSLGVTKTPPPTNPWRQRAVAREPSWCGGVCLREDARDGVRYCGSDSLLAAYTTGFPQFSYGVNGTVEVVTNVNELECLSLIKYIGCARHGIEGGCQHNGNSSVLQVEPFGSKIKGFTTTECRNLCYAGNFTYFGIATPAKRCFCGQDLEPNDAILKPASSCGSFGGYDEAPAGAKPYVYGGCAKQGFLPPAYTCGLIADRERELADRYTGISCWMPVYCTGLDWHDCSVRNQYV